MMIKSILDFIVRKASTALFDVKLDDSKRKNLFHNSNKIKAELFSIHLQPFQMFFFLAGKNIFVFELES